MLDFAIRLSTLLGVTFVLLNLCGCSHPSGMANPEVFRGTPVYELAMAAYDNDTIEMARVLSSSNIDINLQDKKWDVSILEQCIINNRKASFAFLINKRANPWGRDSRSGKYKRHTAFSLASKKDDTCYVSEILSHVCKDSIPATVVVCSFLDASSRNVQHLINEKVHLVDSLGESVGRCVYFRKYGRALLLLKAGTTFNDSVLFSDYIPGKTKNIRTLRETIVTDSESYIFKSDNEVEVLKERAELIEYMEAHGILDR